MKLPRSTRFLSLALGAAFAVSCTVGPDYKQPEITPGVDWSSTRTPRDPLDPDALGRWWERFGDPTLDRLVEKSLAQNLDVRAAVARVAESRAVRDWVAGRKLPEAAVTASLTEQRLSRDSWLPIDNIPDFPRDATFWDVGFDASWEIDLFGKNRRAYEAANARMEGVEEEYRAAQFRVAAEVTRTYLALRGGQRRLASIQSEIDSVRRTADLVERRVEAGETAEIEIHRVEADLRSLEARLPALNADLRGTALAIATLTGDLPEKELALLDQPAPPIELAPFPVGERAEILRRRPDVQAAERRLAAATADIGVAVAELYPKLSIGGHGGFQALTRNDLLTNDSTAWSIVPRISWRFFDGGRVRAEIRIAEARAQQAAIAWEDAVLAALGDAERALAAYLGGLETIERRREVIAAATRTRDLERMRYEGGETTLLGLLDAERRLDEEEAALALAEVDASGDLVALIKSLGGGWSTEPAETPSLVMESASDDASSEP